MWLPFYQTRQQRDMKYEMFWQNAERKLKKITIPLSGDAPLRMWRPRFKDLQHTITLAFSFKLAVGHRSFYRNMQT